jgi:hypothetical protein
LLPRSGGLHHGSGRGDLRREDHAAAHAADEALAVAVGQMKRIRGALGDQMNAMPAPS